MPTRRCAAGCTPPPSLFGGEAIMSEHVSWPRLQRSLVAILRGIRPEETQAVVAGLIDAGFEAIEIPLNSPDPFRSIEIAARQAPSACLIGAGTVLSTPDVARLADAVAIVVHENFGAHLAATAELLARHTPAAARGLRPEAEGERQRRRDRAVGRHLAETAKLQRLETARISQPRTATREPLVIAELGTPFSVALPRPFADDGKPRVGLLPRQGEARLAAQADAPDPGVGKQCRGQIVGRVGPAGRFRVTPVDLPGEGQCAEAQ